MADTAPRHAPFHTAYLWAALLIALGGGFALGTYLAISIGLGLPLGPGFAATIQAHGHLQLLGWVGLFIMGVSTYFVPRLASRRSSADAGQGSLALWLMVCGLTLRMLQPLTVQLSPPAMAVAAALLIVSGSLELLGVAIYIRLLLASVLQRGMRRGHPLAAVRPLLLAAVIGWCWYAGGNLAMLVASAARGTTVLPVLWHRLLADGFVDLVAIPVGLAFAVRLFPLFLRLPAPGRWVGPIAVLLLAGVGLRLGASILTGSVGTSGGGGRATAAMAVGNVGTLVRAAALLLFVWRLDILTRWRLSWTEQAARQHGLPFSARHRSTSARRQRARRGLPDSGEYGRFELPIYAAFAWLVTGAALEGVSAVVHLAGNAAVVSSDAVRHIYLLGFVSHLIMGTAPRMVPGMLGAKRTAYPALTGVGFWLIGSAALLRVLPVALPTAVLSAPSVAWMAGTGLALSGPLALAAVGCLAVNLFATSRQARAAGARAR